MVANWTRRRASTSIRWHFVFRLCCHSNETHAPIVNPPNSAQLGGPSTIPPSYIRVHAIEHKCGKRQTDTQTCMTNISCRLRLERNVMVAVKWLCMCYRIVPFNRMALFMISSRYTRVTCIILPLMRICWQWCHITGIKAVLPLTSRSTGGRGKIEASGWFFVVGVFAFSFFSCFNAFG